MRRVATQLKAKDRGPKGFTLIELLVVIVILGVLVALLLPAILGAVRTAKNAAVLAEINELAQALESFKSRYGDYPPSRVLLVESGSYTGDYSPSSTLSVKTIDSRSSAAANHTDITIGELATRTLSAFRRFWPKVVLSTSGTPPNINSTGYWYDFNGNGQMDPPYVLNGHECLVFFLSGIPLYDTGTGGIGMTGFGKDPANPFSNSIVGNPMYNGNREAPFFDFNAGRLFPDPSNLTMVANGVNVNPGIPGYGDSLNGAPDAIGTGQPVNFYAYFSAYGRGNYDPNDVNFPESDNRARGPIAQRYHVGFATFVLGSTKAFFATPSPSPNPYTTTLPFPDNGTVTYWKPQSFQIISSGADGLYGVGGQYQQQQSGQSSTVSLPFDSSGNTLDLQNNQPETDVTLRQREYDNLTNFKSAPLR